MLFFRSTYQSEPRLAFPVGCLEMSFLGVDGDLKIGLAWMRLLLWNCFICFLQLPLEMKVLRQMAHLYGRSPEWLQRWILKFEGPV